MFWLVVLVVVAVLLALGWLADRGRRGRLRRVDLSRDPGVGRATEAHQRYLGDSPGRGGPIG
ncbi:MAG: hypothetical protein ACRDPH_07920 [Marmoricola sp.]